MSLTVRITAEVLNEIGRHAVAGYPYEACGLLVGTGATGEVLEFHPCDNDARSSRLYTLNARQHLLIERDAQDRGLEVMGVMHSHTHTEAYPSETDVVQAPDPTWHYLIVSLRSGEPQPRSFRIVNSTVTEVPIVIIGDD